MPGGAGTGGVSSQKASITTCAQGWPAGDGGFKNEANFTAETRSRGEEHYAEKRLMEKRRVRGLRACTGDGVLERGDGRGRRDTPGVRKGLDREWLRRPGPEGKPSGLFAVRIRPPIVRAASSKLTCVRFDARLSDIQMGRQSKLSALHRVL